MAFVSAAVTLLASFACAWVLLGFSAGSSAAQRAAKERVRLRLLGWVRRAGSYQGAQLLARIEPLAEVGAACSERLSRKGIDVGAQAGCLIVAVAATALACACAWVAQSWLGLAVGAIAASAAIVALSASLKNKRRLAAEREMPRVFRSLAGSLAAGRTLPQALASLGKNQELSSSAYGRAALAMACGYSATDALSQLARELDAKGAELLVSALLVSHRTGSPLMGLFSRAAAIVEREADLERLLSVKTAQVKLSVRVVCVLPLVMVGVLALISPDFRAGLATPAGRASIAIAFVLDLVAIAIVRRLIASVI